MKLFPYVSVALMALGTVACSETAAQQQSAALYQAAVASSARPTNVVGVVMSYNSGTGTLRLYDGTSYLVPASSDGHQMPAGIVGPPVPGQTVRITYVAEAGHRVVIDLEPESRGDTGDHPD